MMVKCIKQHLSNIWSSIHESVKQNWGWVEKTLYFFLKLNMVLQVYALQNQIFRGKILFGQKLPDMVF